MELVRTLCDPIAGKEDPLKAHEMVELLRAVIREDIDGVALRLEFLRKKYAKTFSYSVAES